MSRVEPLYLLGNDRFPYRRRDEPPLGFGLFSRALFSLQA